MEDDSDLTTFDKEYLDTLKENAIKTLKMAHTTVDLNIHVHYSALPVEEHITQYLAKIHSEGKGNFTRRRIRRKTIYYYCERAGKPRGASTGVSSKTRANNCSAYLSFTFHPRGKRLAVVCKYNLEHKGHDLSQENDKHLNKIHPKLIALIESETMSGAKRNDILLRCKEWADRHNQNNMHDRRYYPSLADIKYQMAKTRKKNNVVMPARKRHKVKLKPKNAAEVERFVKNELQLAIVYYQPLSVAHSKPLIIVYQSEQQKQKCLECGTMVFLDVSHSAYSVFGFVLYCIIVRDAEGKGYPVAYIISSSEAEIVLEIAFQQLKVTNPNFYPSAFMVDKELRDNSAIKNVFPLSAVILSWFDVLQALQNWLTKEDSEVSGSDKAVQRAEIVAFMIRLENAPSYEDFNAIAATMSATVNAPTAEYIQNTWIPHAEKWANYGRTMFDRNTDANTVVERFYLSIKSQFLKGFVNRKIEEMLPILDLAMNNYYGTLVQVGEVTHISAPWTFDLGSAMQKLVQQGLHLHIVWEEFGQCGVPSSNDSDLHYNVNTVELLCSCHHPPGYEMCEHLNLALTLGSQAQQPAETERELAAQRLLNEASYTWHENNLIVYSDIGRGVSVVDLNNRQCTCVAYGYNVECMCVTLSYLLCPRTQEMKSNGVFQQLPSDAHIYSQGLSMVGRGKAAGKKTTTRELLQELYLWANGEDFTDDNDIRTAVKKVHKLAFSAARRKHNKAKKMTIPVTEDAETIQQTATVTLQTNW